MTADKHTAVLTTLLRRGHALIEGVRDSAGYYLHGLYREFVDKSVFLWAQAIAFKVLITIVPILILATGILSKLLLVERPFDQIQRILRDSLPPYQSDQVIGLLNQLQSAGSTLTIIGVVGLILSAMTLFTTLRIVISNVFQEDWHETRSILWGYMFDLRMVAQVGLLFVLSFGLSLSIQAITAEGWWSAEWLGPTFATWLEQGWRQVLQLSGILLPFLLSVLMYYQLYYFTPKPHPPKRSVLAGATVAAVFWEAAKYAFGLYASQVGQFERYNGVVEGTGFSLGQTFGLVIFFVVWVYLSSVILIGGALVTLLYEKRHRALSRSPRSKDAPIAAEVGATEEAPAASEPPAASEGPAVPPAAPKSLPSPPGDPPPNGAPAVRDDALREEASSAADAAPEADPPEVSDRDVPSSV